jgi:hypothetical protein
VDDRRHSRRSYPGRSDHRIGPAAADVVPIGSLLRDRCLVRPGGQGRGWGGNRLATTNPGGVLLLGPLLVSAVVAVIVLAAFRPSAMRRRRCRGYIDLTRSSRRV